MARDPLEFLSTGQALRGPLFAHLLSGAAQAQGGVLPPGTYVGSWKLVRLLGCGGMSEVYLAERSDPDFQQQVAIKIVRGDPDLTERLRHERRVIGGLQHPGIVGLIDGGEMENGRLWFAMEAVLGSCIDRYVQDKRLSWSARLLLVEAVCEAVAHAHARLLVHRDIKPSNVLVDESGRARLLDFGIAISGIPSVSGQDAAMTPGFASPEQLVGDIVTPASDIHQLGQLLKLLLLPRGQPCPTLPKALSKRIRFDLECIVKHATAGDPMARYRTVAGLLVDLQALRQRLPVQARRGGMLYRFGRFGERHRVAVPVAAMVFVAFVSLSVAGSLRISEEITKSRAISTLFQNVLTGVDPEKARELDKTLLRLVLDEAGNRAARELADQPHTLVEVERTIGETYYSLADYVRALGFAQSAYRRAVELDLDAQTRLALGARVISTMHEAQGPRQAVAFGEALLADESQVSARGSDGWYRASTSLAWALHEVGNLERAESLLRSAVAYHESVHDDVSVETLTARHLLGIVFGSSGKFKEAELQLFGALEAATRIDGEDSMRSMRIKGSLAVLYLQWKRFADAESILRPLLRSSEAIFGADHPVTLSHVSNLGGALRQQGKIEESGPFYRRAAEGFEAALGAGNYRALATRHNYANYLLDAGRVAESLETQKRTYTATKELFGGENPLIAELLEGMGKAEIELGDLASAREHLQAAMELKRSLFGQDHVVLESTREALALLARTEGSSATEK